MQPRRSKFRIRVAFKAVCSLSLVACAGVGLSGCETAGLSTPSLPSISNIFDKTPERLPGKRVSVLKSDEKGGLSGSEVSGPLVLPPQQTNASWSQPGGNPTNAPGHLAVGGALRTVWTASAGEGSSKRSRLTAVPVVYEGRIFTLDSEGTVRAIGANNGERIWSVSLLPETEKAVGGLSTNFFSTTSSARAGFGGGLAIDGGKLFVSTGFGTIVALEPASGKPIWTRKIDVPIRQAPTAADGRIFVVNSDSELFCISAADGKDLWTAKGLPESAMLISNASPAVAGNLVFVPYPSGEIAALDVKTGQQKWNESLAKGSVSSSATAIGEAARPVVDGNVMFAMSRGGQLIATSRDKGDRLWSRDISGSQTPWVAGESVFVVDLFGKLIALNRKDGKVRWLTQLPDAGDWVGPVLAGGKLWLASSKGLFVGVDAVSGTIASKTELGGSFVIPPIVAAGKLFVLNDDAKLIAMN